MKFLNKNQYLNLIEACKNILLNKKVPIIKLYLPYLYILFEHAEYISKYQELFESKKKEKNFIKYFRLKKNDIFNKLKFIIDFFYAKDGGYINTNNDIKKDIIIISHLVNRKQLKQKNDFYFGNIPNLLIEKKYQVLVTYINYLNLNFKSISNEIGSEYQKYILPKKLNIFFELKIFIYILYSWIKFKIIYFPNNILEKNILNHISSLKLLLSARGSLKIEKQISILIKKHNPKILLCTFEGHSYERIIFGIAKKINKNIKCIGYQHTCLTNLQNSIFLNLDEIYNPDIILTTGPINKKIIKKRIYNSKIKVGIIGSAKIFDGIFKVQRKNKKLKCLVLPSMYLYETNVLFNFSINLATKYRNINFVFRFHPNFTNKNKMTTNPNISTFPNNLCISNQDIHKDVINSDIVIFRTSGIVISCGMVGLYPIYFDIKNTMSQNPIFSIEEYHGKVSNLNDFDKQLFYYLNTWSKSNSKIENLIKNCKQYSIPIKKESLLEVLSLENGDNREKE